MYMICSRCLLLLFLLFFQADLNTEKVKLALEPEAASVFSRYLPTERRDDKTDIATFPIGTQYLVLDAGGNIVFPFSLKDT